MKYRYNRKLFLVAAMLLTGGVAMAQSGGDEPTPTPTPTPAPGVLIKGNVYGGCEIGNVTKDTYVQMNGGTMEGSVYGGGMGSTENERQGEVLGNATVKMTDGTVERSIYGGGELGSVGYFTEYDTLVYQGTTDTVFVPRKCQRGTGFVQVLMEGGHVGKRGSTMPHLHSNPDDDDRGWIFTGCQGEADSITYHKANALGVVDSTYLEIKGGTVTASVYGGCENGLVLRSTKVKITGGQIGTGYQGNNVWDNPYTEEQWTIAMNAVKNGTIGTIYSEQSPNPFHECDAWPFGHTVGGVTSFEVYDIFYDTTWTENGQTHQYKPANSSRLGYNGHSFFGNVFGGGSGFYPIAPGVWRSTAGQVRKDTYVEITGGHILTSIYGGNEVTDVLGKTHVKMTGGTLGVPRSLEQIAGHPVTCYLFGAGMGDPRILFNTWTNVKDVEVEVSGDAFIFGSIFGGGEEGHVLDSVNLTVKENAFIGTTGTSYVDGNVFGGGRGFSGEALTAGTVGGSIKVNIEGGTMLGSIYGGGRLASVGTMFAYPTDDQGNPNPLYGHMLPDDEDGTHGHIVINIKGGTIGNNHEANAGRIKGGNVFGGSMGRLTLMDGTTNNPIWPNLAKVKDTEINISQEDDDVPTLIKGSVFGGSEYGTVLEDTEINIAGGTIMRSVFGGGFGSDNTALVGKLGLTTGTSVDTVQVKPTQYSGRVLGNTLINTTGGIVTRLVFGGGDLASVGSNFIYTTTGENPTTSSLMPDEDNESGQTQVNILGGTFGMLDKDHPTVPFINKVPYGSIFGAGRGEPVDDNGFTGFTDSHCSFVNKTNVVIGGTSGDGPRIYGSVYGGAQDSYVLQNTSVTVNRGEIGVEYGDAATALTTVGVSDVKNFVWTTRGNVFGGGSGDSEWEDANHVKHFSHISGYVLDSTNVTVNGGLIHRLVYGGGNLASADGHATVTINNAIGNPSNNFSDFVNHDYGGYVFGAGRGETTVDLEVFATTGSTEVNINNGAKVPGNVFGGGALGQVERSTHVNMTGGTVGLIGYTRSSDEEDAAYDGIVHLGAAGTGSVFGGGMGSTAEGLRDAALVHDSTRVVISGGHVLYSVYGGGEVGSVGQRESYTHTTNGVQYTDYKPKQGTVSHADSTGFCEVIIRGGQVGPAPKVGTFDEETYNIPVGLTGTDGYVFGGGRGVSNDSIHLANPAVYPYSGKYYEVADVNNTLVVVDMPMPAEGDNNANRLWGSIFGGSEDGHVLGNARVEYRSGLMGTQGTTSYDGNIFGGGRNYSKTNYNAGRVRGNISVKMSGGQIYGSIFGGGRLALTGVDMYGNVIEDPVDGSGNRVRTYGNVLVKVNGGVVGNDQTVNVPALGGDVPFVETFTRYSMGDVFGGGKGSMVGVARHPIASAMLVSLVRNTEVIIEDSINGNYHTTPKILGSVFGGGEVANVGRYNWTLDQTGVHNIKLDYGGLAKVTVNGGQIGIDKMQMDYTIADDEGNFDLKYHTDLGHVFGGGEGITDNPNKTEYAMPDGINTQDYGNLSLLDLMATVGNTEVTIGGTAWVKGSVYGGSMNGHVLKDTDVKVKGGQIGAGFNPDGNDLRYEDESKFISKLTYNGYTASGDITSADALAACYHWPYDPATNRGFDPIKLKEAPSANSPTDGDTWFGQVFGGGSGYYPYITTSPTTSEDTLIWNPSAGLVRGNTRVEITGGHILTNVFGGCETTDVGTYTTSGNYMQATANSGATTVVMSNGTVGVPRVITATQDYPKIGHVYGAGKGDARPRFDALNNVDTTSVTICDSALVYGSVFGGADEGHVMRGASVELMKRNGSQKTPVVGMTGFSGYDGHVFGGGSGSAYKYYGDTLANFVAGRMGGIAKVTMSEGIVLGNLYGGGFAGRVGVGLGGDFETFAPIPEGDTMRVYDSLHHGLVMVELSGGVVGNNVNGGLSLLLSDELSGNVYGGSRGDPDEHIEDDLGRVANSIVKITESPTVYGSVYGGGQMANSGHWDGYANWYTKKTSSTLVDIQGSPTIGTEKEFKYEYSTATGDNAPKYSEFDTIKGMRIMVHTRTGNVYGGGQGDVILGPNGYPQGFEQGHCGSAEVRIQGDDNLKIMNSVFGGSDQGVVWGDTKVTIVSGTIGTTGIPYDSLTFANDQWTSHNDSTYSVGSVFGGSYGMDAYKHIAGVHALHDSIRERVVDSINRLTGCVYGNTEVNINGGAIRGNVYGGGNMANVGTKIGESNLHASNGICHVNVRGGTIGPLDQTGLNAYVFGGGNGFASDPDELRKAFANVDSTFVTVSGGTIWGSVFGGGNDSHTLGSTKVTVSTGANIGTDGLSTWDGNIFGGGRNFVNSNHTNGRVEGNIDITMTGGTMKGSIFGGGRMALSGVNEEGKFPSSGWDPTKHGNVTINVSGGSIGNTNGYDLLTGSEESVGDIFGSGKGDTKNYRDTLAGRVTNSTISISDSTRIYGAVFGGGEMASLGWWTNSGFINGTGAATITIDGNPEIGTYLELDYGDLTPSHWTMYDNNGRLMHTCTGNVFGGCQGDVDLTNWDEEPNNWPYMGRSRTSTITVNGGKIMGGVFGGPEQGTMDGNTYVNINGGTIGSQVTTNNFTYWYGGVYGAGYGVDEAQDAVPFSLDDVEMKADTIAGRVYGNTLVNVMGGTVADVYGGGNFAYVGDDSNTPNGNCRVNIGRLKHVDNTPTNEPTRDSIPEGNATIKGMVFGANNHAGTPYGSASVHVYKTAHTFDPDNFYPDPAPENAEELEYEPHDLENFAIRAVYGASNLADYTPVAGCNDTVHVYFCEENTIYDVYGGSNAAAVGNPDAGYQTHCCVIIDGGHIYRVFGGGNGEGGIPADIYGSANTYIKGGLIHEVFGGSNTLGNILETNLTVVEGTDCKLIVGDGFGSNNESVAVTDVVTTLECGSAGAYATYYGGANLATIYGTVTVNVMGGEYGNLFAGSKGRLADPNADPPIPALSADIKKIPLDSADIRLLPLEHQQAVMDYWIANPGKRGKGGTVTLNIYGGKIDNAFGGSDVLSDIEGRIMVNVIDTVDQCGLELTNVYGAGRYTTYQPDFVDGKPINSPIVNVIHGNVLGSVFGGGKGATATTIAHPEVHIGYDPDNHIMDSLNDVYSAVGFEFSTAQATVAHEVYGGGEDGDIIGNPTVSVAKANTYIAASVFGGGTGMPDFPDYGKVHGNDTVRVSGGTIGRHVFGGGSVASVTGDSWVEVSGGQVNRSVFGGGTGAPDDVVLGHIEGSTRVSISDDAFVKGNVYGGGQMGQVYQNTTVNVSGGEVGAIEYTWKHDTPHNQPYDSVVHMLGGSALGGSVFGGGQGYTSNTELARVKGNATVNISGGHVQYNVYGGGEMASVGQHTEVHATSDPDSPVINFDPVAYTGLATVNVTGGQVGPAPAVIKSVLNPEADSVNVSIGLNGTDGYVFGGGKGNGDDPISLDPSSYHPYGEYYQFANVNNAVVKVNITSTDTVNNRIWGSVFGGSEDGHVLGSDTVRFVSGYLGTTGTTSYDGNIFGGGRNFSHKNYTAGRVGGNTTVEMTGGQLFGNIYGGGRLALTGAGLTGMISVTELGEGYYQAMQEDGDGKTYGHTKVMVKGGIIGNNKPTGTGDLLIETFSDHSMGSVYGGGMGTLEGIDITGHPKASSLLFGMTKNTEVEVSGTLTGTHIYGIVFGGGEIANVGKFTWKQEGTTISKIDVAEGKAKVSISGGTIGADKAKMRYEKGAAPYDMYPKYNDDLGYVYGGGEGYSDDPTDTDLYPLVNTTRFGDLSLLDLMSSVYETDVNISGGWVKASVFGGAESGHVMGDTKVTISGGQIGAGSYPAKDSLYYGENQFFNPAITEITTANSLAGTYHWSFESPYNPYDPVYVMNGTVPSDGKSWFGNVFGGGSGWFPYIKKNASNQYQSYCNPNSGKVWGNTEVNITGGHILNNVYGANESTDVGGKATVKMSGGTVGVPLTNDQIIARPLCGYIFGGGAGDPRPVYDNTTNVNTTDVQITGGIVYSSVYGGAEDGHILGDSKITVSQDQGKTTVIGSTGKSGYDGNVFGGGRNYFGENVNAGHVAGETTIDMDDGLAMGNVYGGGRSGSVTKSTHVNISGGQVGTEQIGVDQVTIVNGNVYGGGLGFAGGKLSGNAHEFANVDSTYVNISDNAYIINSVFGGGDNGHVLRSTVVNMTGGTVGQKNVLSEFVTDSLENPARGHIYTGSVLAGGRGIFTDITGQYNDTTGIVFGNTNVSISGGTVRHAVYGGGGLSHVGTFTRDASTGEITFTNGGKCTVSVTGGLIGPKKEDFTDPTEEEFTAFFGNSVPYDDDHKHQYADTAFKYIGGNAGWVFGAGCGLVSSGTDRLTFNDSTFVTISGNAQVTGAVYGGGENGHVKNDTRVVVSGGTIGAFPLHGTDTVNITEGAYSDVSFTSDVNELWEDEYGAGRRVFRGDVYGGGKGTDFVTNGVYNPTAGRVYGNTKVTVSGGTIYNRVYGGGSMASVGSFTYYDGEVPTTLPLQAQLQRISYVDGTGVTNVNISGGTIGTDGNNNGDVVGGGRGITGNPGNVHAALGDHDQADQLTRLAYVGATNVNISNTAVIKSNVYGGSINGHVYGDAHVTMTGGTVGLDGHYGWHSNVYGGGGGTGRYKKSNGEKKLSITSGRVFGNTTVHISQAEGKTTAIKGNVYGGAPIASVGTYDLREGATNPVAPETGSTEVTITGGTIGFDGINNGDVFGSGRGLACAPLAYPDSLSYAVQTTVNIGSSTATSNTTPWIKGSVYGSGENGHTYLGTTVNVMSGTIEHSVFGAGEGEDKYSTDEDSYNPIGGCVTGNTEVNVSGGHIKENVYGAGRMASVGVLLQVVEQPTVHDTLIMIPNDGFGVATVNVTGGTIGVTDGDDMEHYGSVFGSGKGVAGAPGSIFQRLAMVKESHVNISEADNKQTFITGSVFGSGEDGHVTQDAYVTVRGGQIGGQSYVTSGEPTPCASDFHGNVYGAGRGVDKYTDQNGDVHYSTTAGKVGGNTYVNIYGGRVVRNVYGGGNLSSVGDAEETPNAETGEYSTGLATVNILGGTIGTTSVTSSNYMNFGNVFGSGHGGVGGEYIHLAFVKNTLVTVDSVALVIGSVFGGGEDGHVRMNTLVDIKGGTIGHDNELDLDGNVYGGGRDISDVLGTGSSSAGEVRGHTTVNIMQSDKQDASGNYYTPVIWDNVFGGGSTSMVDEYKVVNISSGTIKGNVYGGSRDIPHTRTNKAPRWVNMWGGTVEGNIFGCSHNSVDGDPQHDQDWASFINLSGGTVKGSVFGASDYESTTVDEDYGGAVKGSVGILIGKNAIESVYTAANVHKPTTVVRDSLVILGNVYAGSEHVKDSVWGDYAVTGYSHIFIDGMGYNTTDTHVTDYMNIGGGIFGSGTHCGAGKAGHNILVREYGTRDSDTELTTATRTLTTIQRGGLVVLDNVNVNLSGATDISNTENTKKYGALKIDEGLYVTNASGLVLGEEDKPVLIDSVKQVRSLWLKNGVNMYTQLTSGSESNWEVVGLRKDDATGAYNTLYRIDGTPGGTALTSLQENVIIYNDTSKLMVCYHDKKEGDASYKQYYGELQGFFRMRGDAYDPHTNMKSFAYARPKITDNRSNDNTADGGFLSYDNKYNFFTDNGADHTKTKQYPYLNVLEYSKGDRKDYRIWVAQPLRDTCWYVDGTRGWGHDILKTVDYQVGRFPDKPKKTLFGKTNGVKSGVISEEYPSNSGKEHLNFSYEDDLIYVVGALSAEDEKYILRDSIIDTHTYPLLLYRYPGGHKMSNDEDDYGGGKPTTGTVVAAGDWGVQGEGDLAHAGPGANYGAMLDVQAGQSATLRGVVMDGLYGYTVPEVDSFNIPTTFTGAADSINFHQAEVNRPMILTHSGSTLNVGGGTILKRGYNNTDAYDWYTNADYTPYDDQGVLTTYQGAAIFVDSLATVNVSGLDSIIGNKQKLGTGEVESNVYLPTFSKYVNITPEGLNGGLDANTRIGITSPKRNKAANYKWNTFSPVAVATSQTIANNAYQNNNFSDDMEMFFVNNYTSSNKRSTYYANTIPDYPVPADSISTDKTLFFGWTWANAVRKRPDGFNYSYINSPEDLAWLISHSTGMNLQTATDFSTAGTIEQTADIDLQQYVWVPIGDSLNGSGRKPFAGTYDGRAHLIKNLSIQYIGKGDRRYERLNYGLFGCVKGGKINRTFVVSGKIKPEISTTADVFNLGGLVGCLDGANAMVSNSEAAVNIEYPGETTTTINAGGLVAEMASGEIHSSMAMPNINIVLAKNKGAVGGLVGKATGGAIRNSFANSHFGVTYAGDPAIEIGGLVGNNNGATMVNCYMALYNAEGMNLQSTYFGRIAGVNSDATNIARCYAVTESYSSLPYVISSRGSVAATCGDYTPVIGADNLGYMYYDNRVQLASLAKPEPVLKEALYKELNRWVTENGSGRKYAYWSRPALSEINGDLPVLMINNSDGNIRYQGDLTSLGTYEGGPALQYGGNVRDDYQLALMLEREESIFVYGDVVEDLSSTSVEATKVSIHEDVAITQPWHEAYDNTYVGISFDNSHKNGIASSSAGINHLGMFDLPRDWHMLSTPLSNAPLGFNYMLGNVNTNETGWTSGDHGTYYNNPWKYYHSHDENDNYEFSWLNGGTLDHPTTGPNRYWMKGWENSRSQYENEDAATGDDWVDGYFPSRVANYGNNVTGFAYNEGCMADTDEKDRYPYGMDFFCWYEAEPQWINFKRNGPNHWHSDEIDNEHLHLGYTENNIENKNEDNLVVGKGYMMAICDTTFMQSHGTLNWGDKSRTVTRRASTPAGAPYIGWNLVGNPYHAYLDFDKFADFESYDPEHPTTQTVNGILTSYEEGKTPFYVIYDADQYVKDNGASSAYIVYPATGSDGGAYAGRFLHPHQGFFVRVNKEGSLTFKEEMTVARRSLNVNNDGHFRGDTKINYPLVNLFLSSDKGCADVTVVELERPRLGGAHKMHELRSGNGIFYARLEDNDYAAVFAPEGTERVPIWFEPTEDDIFTISWNTANANFSSLYLVDNLTGVKYDMLLSDRYIFEAHKFDYKSRFYITFSLEDEPEDDPLEGQEVFVFFDGSEWVVTGEGDLEFIDMLGRVLMRTHVNGGQTRVTTPWVANGLYFMRLTNGKDCKLQKVIVNHEE